MRRPIREGFDWAFCRPKNCGGVATMVDGTGTCTSTCSPSTGVFARRGDGLAFWLAPALSALDVAEVLAGVPCRGWAVFSRAGAWRTPTRA